VGGIGWRDDFWRGRVRARRLVRRDRARMIVGGVFVWAYGCGAEERGDCATSSL